MTKQLYPSDSYILQILTAFRHCTEKHDPAKGLTVTQASTCIRIYEYESYLLHKYTLKVLMDFLHVFLTFSTRQNDVTPSNVKETMTKGIMT